MTGTALLGFAGLCLLLAIAPGPDTFLVLRYGLAGPRFGVLAAAGSAIGSLFWAAAVALGLADLLRSSPTAFLVVKVVGGLYLLYLGVVGFLRRDEVVDPGGGGPVRSRWGPSFRSGVLSCLLNPKVGLFFLAVVPQFLPAEAIAVGTIMVLGLVDAVVAFGWLAALVAGAARAVGWLRRPRVSRGLAGLSSVALCALGVGTIAAVI
ncbi:LysE family translocator [Saccharothrix australiensis]|uniref:Threonine/homoserine/homoserine lactone efflux protein n=1 Tax=Saccharothrix australiensis TaxID=2072 RepID=A0A495VY88_9PSEU|nr:LysE family translocator [Saccharothrix australiensis]RKT54174.1 threonine/homoserine/homoserine lactone efflux protein [Saccharothrix australiensis]